MEDHNLQIKKLLDARDTLVAERQVIVNSLKEASEFLETIGNLVRHQEYIEAIDRIIKDEEKLGKSPYGLRNV